jgi:hypothetical protein
MRRRLRYTVHRRLLLTFLLLGCAGSFVLGQEMARAFAAIPVYAAQSLTFSGAGITASLVTPLQATGSIGQPTPQPKVVKQPSKPTNKLKSKGPTTKPLTPPQQAPVKSPPIVLHGVPVQVSSTVSPCESAACLPGVKPAPPVVPPPAAAPTGIASNDFGSFTAAPNGVSTLHCAPHGLVSQPASPLQGGALAHCDSVMPTNGASSTTKPQPVSPGVGATPAALDAPQVALPAPVINPVAFGTGINLTLAPTTGLADTADLPSAGNNPQATLVTICANPDDPNPADIPATPATDQRQCQG